MDLPRPSLRCLSQAILALAGIAAVAGVVVLLLQDSSPGAVKIVLPTSIPPVELKVYLTGAVREPGVYLAAEGDQLAEVIEAAGGATQDANLTAVNLAVRVRDEDHWHVPAVGEAPSPVVPQRAADGTRIDINSASAEDLEELPEIGEVRAKDIVQYRDENGPFTEVESLLAVFVLSALLFAAWLALGRREVKPALLLSVLFLGMIAADGVGDPPSALNIYHGSGAVQVDGVVDRDPESAGTAYRFQLKVEKMSQGGTWSKASADLLVTVRESPELARSRDRPYFRYGDRLLLEGIIESPPELDDFDYPAYLSRQKIGSVMQFPVVLRLEEGQGSAFKFGLFRMRRRLADSLAEFIPEPQASLGQALLLGLRDDLPDETVDEFWKTGTAHLLAISGLHVGVLLALSLGLGARVIGRRRQLYLLLPLVLMWLYALVLGMSPSVTRAAIMGTVYLAALFFGWPRSALPAVGLAVAAMVAASPIILWSVSFQLSFVAIIGITLLSEPIVGSLRQLYEDGANHPHGSKNSWFGLLDALSYAAAMPIAATAATFPLALLYFEQLSWTGLPTTLAILPMLPFILVANAIAGLVGLMSAAVAEPFGWLAWIGLAYMTGVVGAVSRLPGASFETGAVAPFLVWAYYAVLTTAVARPAIVPRAKALGTSLRSVTRAGQIQGAAVPWWALLAAIVVASLVWVAALSGTDGGPDPLDMVRFLGDRMPFRDRTLDLVVLTHGHAGHVNGLVEVLRRYKVETVLQRVSDHEGAPYEAWHRAVGLEGSTVVTARPGMVIALDDGAFIEVLGPPERLLKGTESAVDNASVVLRLVYRDVSFLLTGDMFDDSEGALVRREARLDSDVLKVGHPREP
jgi:competence protein ComEC